MCKDVQEVEAMYYIAGYTTIIDMTPGAVVINDGDMLECRIEGFEPLVNHEQDRKVASKSG